MRLLVCPHDLQIGGSQINAIDLAAGAAAAPAGDFISLDESQQTLDDIISKNANVITYFTAA